MSHDPIADERPAARVSTKRALLLSVTLLAGAILGSTECLLAQDENVAEENAAESDPWEPLRFLEGTWAGAIDGRLGQGTGRRSYEFIFDGLYLVSKHASVRPPQDESPAGDHHRELAVYSYDRARDMIILREFMLEGFVLNSSCKTEPKRFVCTAEIIESGPGMQARLTIEIRDPYHFKETFELASPGDELQVYFTNTWARIPDLDVPW